MAEALEMVHEQGSASVLLHPMRQRILDLLREPGSASTVARQLSLPRQKVNYHLRELEKAGFLEQVEERRAGNCIERIVRAKATHYLIDPQLLGNLGADPSRINDRFSAAYLVALAGQAIRDVAAAQRRAEESGRRVATFSMEVDVRFATATDRKAFMTDLANAVAQLVHRYHDERAEGGRNHRLFLGAYPAKKKEREP